MMQAIPPNYAEHMMCGPTAITAVTGCKPIDVLAACHRYMGRPITHPIVGMSDEQITGALALLGFRVKFTEWHIPFSGLRPTFRQYTIQMPRYPRPVIVRFAKHVAAITYDEYLCTVTDAKPVPIAQAPYQSHRVHGIFEVEAI